MARLEYDFADQNVAKLFPTHGWAANSQGAKILWLPLNRLLAWPHQTLRKGGSSQTLPPGAVLDASPFAHTLRKLVITLRELHRLIRVSCDHPCILDEDNPEARTAGLCHLMTGIHSAIRVGSEYEWGDFLILMGIDHDIVGYWPQIKV